jgi:hypothetical protein
MKALRQRAENQTFLWAIQCAPAAFSIDYLDGSYWRSGPLQKKGKRKRASRKEARFTHPIENDSQ